MSVYRVFYGMNGTEYPMRIHIPNCRRLLGDGQLAVGAGTIGDLNTSIATNTDFALPNGIPTTSLGFKPSTPLGPEQEVLREAWANWVTPYGNFGAFIAQSVGNYWKLKNGSKIIISAVSVGSLPVAYTEVTLEFRNAQNVKCYNDLTVSPRLSSYAQNIDLYSMPFLFVPNDGYYINYIIINAYQTYANAGIRLYGPISTALGRSFWDGIEPEDEDDPYPDVPDSDDDDPDGDGIPDPDPIPFPDIPTIDATDTGFVSLYAPTKQQIRALSSYMWSSSFDLDTFKKIFADPMDCILGLNIVPVSIPTFENTSSVTVGNIDTGVEMYKAIRQWVEFDCGSLDLGSLTDTYLDYSPHSKWSIYLPYIGIQQLSADDVAHKILTVKYHVDILSCACVAYLKCGDSVLYQFAGSCGSSIPVTSVNFAQMISSIISIGATAGTLIAGGATAPVAVGAMASTLSNVMNLKPDVKRGGSIGSSAGLLGIQKPFVIVELPNVCKPAKQHHYIGYPSFITKTISDLSGYAEFESVIVDGVPCTDEEREMIIDILKGGVYV